VLRGLLWLLIATGLGTSAYFTRDHWKPVLFPVAKAPTEDDHDDHDHDHDPSEQVLLTKQAQKNLRLTTKPLKPVTFWKTITVPGILIDRPGFGDRGVVAPVTGIVSRIHKVAGEPVQPGEVLFTIKLLSETIHQTQTDLFKATQDIKLTEAQRKRLLASGGAVAEARVIEVENQLTRLEVATKAYRQELLNRGLPPEQLAGVAEGKFVTEIPIVAPARTATIPATAPESLTTSPFELQELKVELGQQVQAGQTLCLLANHQLLSVEGRAFRDESILLERVLQEGWPIEIDFDEEPGHGWGTVGQTFKVTYIANTIDPESRTFRFLMPLDNQTRAIEKDGKSLLLWRFRPGQRVRLLVRVEKLDNVFVLPADAVARDGADTYVFRQNGDIFDRKPVHVIYRDRTQVVVANDGSVPANLFVAQTGAVQLNRMVKSQSGTTPKGFHVHADGSVHMGNH
jgi:multidrug efflux pump subunit AcrA (membrane-fusion protein)